MPPIAGSANTTTWAWAPTDRFSTDTDRRGAAAIGSYADFSDILNEPRTAILLHRTRHNKAGILFPVLDIANQGVTSFASLAEHKVRATNAILVEAVRYLPPTQLKLAASRGSPAPSYVTTLG